MVCWESAPSLLEFRFTDLPQDVDMLNLPHDMPCFDLVCLKGPHPFPIGCFDDRNRRMNCSATNLNRTSRNSGPQCMSNRTQSPLCVPKGAIAPPAPSSPRRPISAPSTIGHHTPPPRT